MGGGFEAGARPGVVGRVAVAVPKRAHLAVSAGHAALVPAACPACRVSGTGPVFHACPVEAWSRLRAGSAAGGFRDLVEARLQKRNPTGVGEALTQESRVLPRGGVKFIGMLRQVP